ncbi:hypothetical protein FCULG_00000261 [Fusarium culmorum]|uniref:Uncharacterized protein n=1 Tax=Fusarium culmorum TaxID=5516 RepID=A0A2T4GJU7_FUSCU|nr:hypothetical protein FCULG_00000261 [Fusarium culmorum]
MDWLEMSHKSPTLAFLERLCIQPPIQTEPILAKCRPYIYVLTETQMMHEAGFNDAVDNFAREECLQAYSLDT